ncbi:MAG: hypothetical protein AAF170_14250 [Bacteroidota bacterium]
MIRTASSILGLSLAGLLGLASLMGCSRSEPEPPPPAPPGVDQIEADLVGQRFVFFEDADGEREWTIEASEIRRVQIVDTVRAGDSNRMRVRARVMLASPNRTIQGDLRLDYAHAGGAWQVQGVQRVGPNFIAGDGAFVLFDVSALPEDTLGNSRGLSLDVIARYDEGAFIAPLDRFRPQIDALADSVFVGDSLATADSLRQLAESRLASEVGAAYARRGTSVRVLLPGEAPETVAVRDVEVGILGCEFLNAKASSAVSLGRDAALGTTSSVIGGAVVPGRPLNADERRQLDGLARDRLRVQGLDSERVRSGGSLAVDLDGDGSEDWIGAFAVGSLEAGTARGLVVGAQPLASSAPRLLLERMTAPGFGTFTLVGAVDLDADGASEVILLEQGTEVYQYLILTHRAGRFATAFRGGGGGC